MRRTRSRATPTTSVPRSTGRSRRRHPTTRMRLVAPLAVHGMVIGYASMDWAEQRRGDPGRVGASAVPGRWFLVRLVRDRDGRARARRRPRREGGSGRSRARDPHRDGMHDPGDPCLLPGRSGAGVSPCRGGRCARAIHGRAVRDRDGADDVRRRERLHLSRSRPRHRQSRRGRANRPRRGPRVGAVDRG